MVKIKYIEITPEIKSWLDKILFLFRSKRIEADCAIFQGWCKQSYITVTNDVWITLSWDMDSDTCDLAINIAEFGSMVRYHITEPKEYLKQFYIDDKEALADDIIKILNFKNELKHD